METTVLGLLLLVTTVTLTRLDVSVVCSLDLLTSVAWLGASIVPLAVYYAKRRRPVYLVEFACYKPSDERKITMHDWLEMTKATGSFNDESMDFMAKIVRRSGLGDETYMPARWWDRSSTIADGREETTSAIFGCMDALFAATGVDPRRDVDVVVVNCGTFCPTPSLAAAIVNRYGMRDDVRAFNLGGMGCSAGLVAVDLAARLLRATAGDRRAVVFTTENITRNSYFGADRSMLLPNCIFRVGGAAALLSNRRADAGCAKYALAHTVRTHRAAAAASFACVRQREDGRGEVGVSLARELMAVAGDALASNLAALGPRVLPLGEQLRFVASVALRRVFPKCGHLGLYVPDFRRAFDHFCVHAGGRAVLEEIQRSLKLDDADMEPSRCTLHRFGNTSSSSLWYELAYAEAKGRVRRGHRVWQVGFGSGFKCNSAVWRALRDVPPVPAAGADAVDGHQNRCNPWVGSVQSYPKKVYVASL